LYLRGLIEQGPRKSLEPLVERLGGEADYQSMQQFLADSPWDPALVVKAVAERVAPEIGVEAWVLDDTGFPKDGKDSPGVKRQYSGTLGRSVTVRSGCRCTRSGSGDGAVGVGAVSARGLVRGPERRRKAKIPDEVVFKTKPELGVELVERAGLGCPAAPVLGDHAYGDNTWLRERLIEAGCEYVLSVGPRRRCSSTAPRSTVPNRPRSGGARKRPRPTASPSRSAS
jgi:SRSO17 transposase